jgi:5-formyltetrahydrofolate cyclo-ligase
MPAGLPSDDNLLTKRELRSSAKLRRAAVNRRGERSLVIGRQLAGTTIWQQARTVSIYVDFRDEVETRWLLAEALAAGKRVAVPFCRPDRSLGMFALTTLSELQPGKFGILEPPPSAQADPARQVSPAEFDLVVVPGLAFDRQGHRLGYGQGHYDRVLPHVRPDCWKVALAFDQQLVAAVPIEPHDIPLDSIVHETGVIVRNSAVSLGQ